MCQTFFQKSEKSRKSSNLYPQRLDFPWFTPLKKNQCYMFGPNPCFCSFQGGNLFNFDGSWILVRPFSFAIQRFVEATAQGFAWFQTMFDTFLNICVNLKSFGCKLCNIAPVTVEGMVKDYACRIWDRWSNDKHVYTKDTQIPVTIWTHGISASHICS